MGFDIIWILKTIPAAIIGLTVHEYSHALASYKLGDFTAKENGRLTLNPIKHIDPIGFLLIIIAGFGWVKPVTFNRENLKHKHRDEIIIALAGPISNFILGFLFILIARVLFFIPFFSQTNNGIEIENLIILWGVINFGLGIFNLIPIPPLDGSHIYTTFIKDINENALKIIYKVGTWVLLIIVYIQNKGDIEIIPITPIISKITNTIITLLRFN